MLNLVKSDPKYRAVELAFDTNLAAVMDRLKEDVIRTFAANGFKNATIVLDVVNPSTKHLFR